MPTAGSRSICSISLLGAVPAEHEAEAQLQRRRLLLRGAEPEVEAALAEPSTPRLPPRFARCCGMLR